MTQPNRMIVTITVTQPTAIGDRDRTVTTAAISHEDRDHAALAHAIEHGTTASDPILWWPDGAIASLATVGRMAADHCNRTRIGNTLRLPVPAAVALGMGGV